MAGITRIGTYFPRRRLDRALIAKAWGGRAAGTRTVAGVDEDALTLAADAAVAALGDADTQSIDACYFASTTAPYLEKQVASLLATALDLPRRCAIADFTGSTRAGLTALRVALDGVRSGSFAHALVATGDTRAAEPGTELEASFGDAGAAVTLGRDGAIAEFVTAASVAEEFTHFYRKQDDTYVQAPDTRFGNQYGFVPSVVEAVTLALKQAELPIQKVAKLAIAVPDARAGADVAKKLGADAAKQLEAHLIAEAGVTGSPDPLLLLAKSLETAQPGDFIVVAAYGEGADALVFRATEALTKARPRGVAASLAGGIPLASYERYLRARGILRGDSPGEPVTTYAEWKELKQNTRLYGSKCGKCGQVQYPMNRVCVACQAREGLVDVKLAKRGTIFTYTNDTLAPVPELPFPMLIVDLDDGARLYLQGTEFVEAQVQVGARVELTFRRLHDAGDNHNYFWKARPLL